MYRACNKAKSDYRKPLPVSDTVYLARIVVYEVEFIWMHTSLLAFMSNWEQSLRTLKCKLCLSTQNKQVNLSKTTVTDALRDHRKNCPGLTVWIRFEVHVQRPRSHIHLRSSSAGSTTVHVFTSALLHAKTGVRRVAIASYEKATAKPSSTHVSSLLKRMHISKQLHKLSHAATENCKKMTELQNLRRNI